MVEDSETLGHGLVGVAEASAGQAEEGDDGLGPVAVVAEVFQSDVALALGQFGAVGVDDQRQVREPRRLPTERPALKKTKIRNIVAIDSKSQGSRPQKGKKIDDGLTGRGGRVWGWRRATRCHGGRA